LENSEINVPFDKIHSLTSDGPLTVSLLTGDQVVGPIVIGADHKLRVRSALLGELVLPTSKVAKGRPVSEPQATKAAKAPPAVALLTPDEASSVTGRGGQQGTAVAQAPAPPASPSGGTQPQGAPAQGTPAQGTQAQPEGAPSGTPKEEEEDTKTQLRFLRTDTVLLEKRDIETDFALTYLRNDSTEPPASDRAITMEGTVRVGLLTGLESFLSVPYTYGVRDLQLGTTVSDKSSGIGDIRFGATYRVIDESANWPAIFIGGTVSAPTGDDAYINLPFGPDRPIDIRDISKSPLGSGHWILSGRVSVLRSYDPVVLFAGFEYAHSIAETYYGRDIQPGDRYNVNLGLGFSISEYSTLGIQMLGSYEEKWTFNGVTAPGTDSYPLNARLSYTHRLNNKNFVEPSIVFGLTEDSTDASLGLVYTHRF